MINCYEKGGDMKLAKAKDIMTKKLLTASPNDSIYKIVDQLIDNGISGMPVVNEKHELIGIVSEKDCLEVLTLGGYHGLKDGYVSDYMTETALTVDPETDILEIAKLFEKYPYRRIPVIDNKKLVGQISRRDVLKEIREMSAKSPTKF